MAEITLKINQRGYSMSCDEGQEERLSNLAQYVDSRLRDIAAAGAATNDSHLLVLTSLVLADEVFDMREELTDLREKVALIDSTKAIREEGSGVSKSSEEEAMIIEAIDYLASRIEHISGRLQICGQSEKTQRIKAA